ncbi:uncharacterized protein LOC6494423 [Drosophila ananassae]|uniref:uncharacterized protein LOC6494423 n=1 Tax=Drosophila ananassae TaxID=7217 RepID=UPI0013A5D244|nr:uncharacterized protein LOC6494423 [Drosophila ananassae]
MNSTDFLTLCKSLFDNSLSLLCSGMVPEHLSRKYQYKLLRAHDPYSIFYIKANPGTYLVAFQSLEMPDCQNVTMLDLNNIQCQNQYNEQRDLHFGYSYRMCFNYSMNLTDELSQNCGARSYEYNQQSGYYFANEDNSMDINFLSNGGVLVGSPALFLYLVVSLLMVLILLWSDLRMQDTWKGLKILHSHGLDFIGAPFNAPCDVSIKM